MESSIKLIQRNKETISKFETMINTADKNLAKELISEKASFYTPASPEPLYGGEGYLSLVFWLRKSFSDVQWKLEEIIAEPEKVAVKWTLTGTHDGEFLGISATQKHITTTFMNFYYFDKDGKITKDVAAEGMIGLLRPLGLSK